MVVKNKTNQLKKQLKKTGQKISGLAKAIVINRFNKKYQKGDVVLLKYGYFRFLNNSGDVKAYSKELLQQLQQNISVKNITQEENINIIFKFLQDKKLSFEVNSDKDGNLYTKFTVKNIINKILEMQEEIQLLSNMEEDQIIKMLQKIRSIDSFLINKTGHYKKEFIFYEQLFNLELMVGI